MFCSPSSVPLHRRLILLALISVLILCLTACRTTQSDTIESNADESRENYVEYTAATPPSENGHDRVIGDELNDPGPELEYMDCRKGGCDGGGECVPRREIDCAVTAQCQERGRCSLIFRDAEYEYGEYLCTDWIESVCGAVNDEDCLASNACKTRGFCRAGSFESYYNKCFSEDESDCFELVTNVCMVTPSGCMDSSECASRGNCGVQAMHWGSTCRPREETHCQQSALCREHGQCGLVVESGTACAATLQSHCEQSEACRIHGMCSKAEGRDYCVALEASDCLRAEVCELEDKCFVSGGRCRTAAEAQASDRGPARGL